MKRKTPALAVLRALLRNYNRAMQHPKIARMVFYRRQFFKDPFIAEIVVSLMLNLGDWTQTKSDLSKLPNERFKKFCAWAEAVKGGAL